ncbi:MAG: hypothetical protein RIC19_08655 [Phaeodactylibacter sp.]|uniref:hypothetical protein n=1 Tax=Phaeodactylibacter sp. TaxID=1940289 RepID=UPI0032EA991F
MKKVLFTIDNVVQSLLLGSSVFFPFTFVAAFFLGCWQLGSSLLKAILLQSRLHLNYFLAATAYCLVLFAGAQTAGAFNYEPTNWVGYLWFVLALPPLVGGIWYFVQSMRDLGQAIASPSEWV